MDKGFKFKKIKIKVEIPHKEIIETGERIYDDPKEIAFQLFITLDGLGITKKDINYIADELKNNNDLIKMRKYGSDRDGITYICR